MTLLFFTVDPILTWAIVLYLRLTNQDGFTLLPPNDATTTYDFPNGIAAKGAVRILPDYLPTVVSNKNVIPFQRVPIRPPERTYINW